MEDEKVDFQSQANNFFSLFKSDRLKGEIIKWTGDDAIGVSILRNYPSSGQFVPILNQKGEPDTVAVIKIGYWKSDYNSEKKTAPLIVKIHKASRYKFNHPWFEKSDQNSPDPEKIKTSSQYKQPIDLDDPSRYELHFQTNKIYDLESKKYTTPEKIADDIYDMHMKTLTDIKFRAQIKLQEVAIRAIDPINITLKTLNQWLFGKRFKKSQNLFVGTYQPYDLKDLVDLSTISDKPKILGTDFPITYQSATSFLVFVLIIFLVHYWFNFESFGLYELFVTAELSPLFLTSLVSILLLTVDRVIPYLIVVVINLLIRFKWYLSTYKISIK